MRPPRPGSLGYNAIVGTAGATVGASSGAAPDFITFLRHHIAQNENQ